VALFLDWSFGLTQAADLVKEAVRRTVAEGIRTPDIGGTASTEDVAEAIMARMWAQHRAAR
ncbi:MAG: isocitrate/isopropylmalate family dehydrogenase, partial [Thermaerobacter sp.]|nr:isocitrate/isopropylmalate family dehydrogenase [Thermaerobacter sp.]